MRSCDDGYPSCRGAEAGQGWCKGECKASSTSPIGYTLKPEFVDMKEQNELLRSAFEIAQRQGKDTNWEAFANNLKAELIKQGGADPQNEQEVLRVTCTPKTYRIYRNV